MTNYPGHDPPNIGPREPSDERCFSPGHFIFCVNERTETAGHTVFAQAPGAVADVLAVASVRGTGLPPSAALGVQC